ncbi:MAG: type II secretion system F family protein [Phascolarctobacterium sp.]|nr:type II secretion system F family protein [Candidatus Phascolarctobacterium caballi]
MNWFKRFDLWWHRPKLADFYFLFTQMYLLLNSGRPLQDAMASIAGVIENEPLKLALNNIVRKLQSGMNAAVAINAEKIFPQVVAPTVEAGDKAGQLSASFFRLGELMWLQHNLYSKVANALFVPKLGGVLMVIIVVGYVKFAIPEYIKMYKENGMEIPGIIESVSGSVNLVVDYWYVTAVVLYFLWQGFKKFYNSHKHFFDRIKLHTPIYKQLHFTFLQHQLVSTLGLMMASGLNMPDSLVQATKVVDNSLMSSALVNVRADILKGNALSLALKRNNKDKVFDSVLLLVLDSGEKTNRMREALDNAKDYYERILASVVEPLSTKITFVVMVPMGLMIVAIYAFTMIPMLSYMNNVSG